MIKLFINHKEVKFETTIFPDGTSQVWKLESTPKQDDTVKILWMFENEAELIHVCQLSTLLQIEYANSPTLVCPYLPYARQDKAIKNGLSFSANVFFNILRSNYIYNVESYDVHSEHGMVKSTAPVDFHKSVLNHDFVCFPDKGAYDRYGNSSALGNTPLLCAFKVRNQETGEITGLNIPGASPTLLGGKKILIVDDICDGGMTFIKVAEVLKQYNPTQIDLVVSHGLFSKGKGVLHDAGITNVYTTNSLLRNPEGYRLW